MEFSFAARIATISVMVWATVRDAEQLTQMFGEPSYRAANKDRRTLHALDVQWLAASPFCLVGTSDASGRCDVSPKGDPPGSLVHVLDDATIALAERPGNHRMDGYRNIIENPFVGLNFFVPGRGDTLRINGRASLVTEAPFFDDLQVKGHRPILCLVVDIEQVFHHCAKAFMRSKLWQPETWAAEAVPDVATLTRTLIPQAPETIEELREYYGPSYSDRLYPKQ